MTELTYRERPEWSYSDMKVILEHDIDYAVAVKHKLLEQSFGKAIDIGTLMKNYSSKVDQTAL